MNNFLLPNGRSSRVETIKNKKKLKLFFYKTLVNLFKDNKYALKAYKYNNVLDNKF